MLIRRDDCNPIIERDTIVGYDALFNPGTVRIGNKILMTVRAARDSRKLVALNGDSTSVHQNQICDHILFESHDEGETFNFTQYKMTGSSSTWFDGYTGKITVPTYFGPFGTEDLRLCKVKDTYVGVVHVMTHAPYTGDAKAGGRIGLVLTKDFRHYRRYLVGPERCETDRDAWIIDQGDRIVFIHRLKPDEAGLRKIKKPGIQVAYFNNLEELMNASPKYWYEHCKNIHEHVIMSPKYEWEALRIGAGPILEHKEGYIMFYHGASLERVYSTGVALLDKTTLKEIGRLKDPLLKPEEWYEKGDFGGDVRNITFVGGAVYSRDKTKIQLYYGAADTHVARADVETDLLVNMLI